MKPPSPRKLLRMRRLEELVTEAGTAKALADKMRGTPESHISACRAGRRGIGDDLAAKFEKAMGKPEGWMDKPPGWKGEQHSSEGPGASVAHGLSLREPDHAPTLQWGVNMDDLPPVFWVSLPDDSMAPRAPAGKRVQFDSTLTPGAGDGVLVRDRAGGLYFRLYRSGGPRWTAYALNQAYQELDSERDGLQVLAVLTAEGGRWS